MTARRRVAVAASLLSAACATGPAAAPATSAGDLPGPLVPTGAIRGGFLARQRVIGLYAGRRIALEAVLQKRGDTLTLIGLTPFGSRAFVLTQRGTDVRLESSVPGPPPFAPVRVLVDVGRTLFFRLAEGPLSDGEHVAEREGERIRERWRDGRLYQRTFRRIAADPAGAIEIRYLGGMAGDEPPARIEYVNGRLGYTLTIETLSYQRLPPVSPSRGSGPPPRPPK